MSYRAVFDFLLEVFPQVDVRLLKAVAIEHYNEAEAAVEYIVSEVLPCLSGPSESPCLVGNFSGSSSLNKDSNVAIHAPHEGGNDSGLYRIIMSSYSQVEHLNSEEEQNSNIPLKPVGFSEPNSHAAGVNHTFRVNSPYLDETFVHGPFPDATCKNATRYGEGSVFPWSMENDDIDKRIDLRLPSSEQYSHVSEVDDVVSDVFAKVPHLLSSTGQTHSGFTRQGFPVELDVGTSDHEREESFTNFQMKNSELLDSNGDMINLDDSMLPSTTTQSGLVRSIDVLEDFLDGVKNKETFLSEMQTVINTAHEVAGSEKDAFQAKNDSLKAGIDILSNVEQLKRMLAQAKETNYMHSREVYGEKLNLATEAQELQSQLLSLANEKHEALSKIEEIKRILETRLAAAKSEKEAVEIDILEREENAQKALHEHVIAMEQVAQESKRLWEEAEGIFKLREYLVDRGCMIDKLKREMAVISEDIMSLKERVDDHVPLSKVIQESTMSIMSDTILNPVELSGSVSAMTE